MHKKIDPFRFHCLGIVNLKTLVLLFTLLPIFGNAQSDFEKMKAAEEAYRKKQESAEKTYATDYESRLDSLHLEYINYEIEREKEVIKFEGKNLDPRLIEKVEALEVKFNRANTFFELSKNQTVLEQLKETKKDLEKQLTDSLSKEPKKSTPTENSRIEGVEKMSRIDTIEQSNPKPISITQVPLLPAEEKKILEQEFDANRPIYIPIMQEDYRISSHFNPNRMHPVLKKPRPHKGIDLAAKTKTPIYVTANGIVEIARFSKSAGNWVMINHKNGYKTKYFHMTSFVVKPNQEVKAGDLVGYVGTTGYSSGPHLHYEIRRRNTPLDPHKFMVIHFSDTK